MAASPVRSMSPIKATTPNKIPTSAQRIMSSQSPHESHTVSAPVNRPEEKSPTSRMPKVLRDSRTVFKDIQNISPPASEIPRYNFRPPTRSTTSKLPKTQLKPPFPKLGYPPSSPLTILPSQPLIAHPTPASSPLVISRKGANASKLGVTVHGHVRSRHRMVPPHAGMFIPAIPPFKASYMKPDPPALTPATGSRSLPLSSSFVRSESFDLLKESIFNEYYRPSVSSDSLATLRLASDNQRQGKSRPAECRRVYSFRTSSGHDGIASSAPQTGHSRLPIGAGHALHLASELPSKQLYHCPPLTSTAMPTTKLPTLLVGRRPDKCIATSTPTKDETVGFPVDMLDVLSSLETLAGKVKTLEMPSKMPKSKSDGGCLRDASRKQSKDGRSKEYEDMPINNSLSINSASISFSKLEKEKWRAVEPDVQDHAHRILGTSSPVDSDWLPLDLLNTQVKPTNPQCSNVHWYLYNPYVAPEFLAGCSTSPILYRAYGYHSRPATAHRSPACRTPSLPSRLPSPKRQASPGRFWKTERRTASPSMPPRSLPSKSLTLKSLLQRSRPRSRSEISPKPASPSIPISHRPVENVSVRGLAKPRFHWLKI